MLVGWIASRLEPSQFSLIDVKKTIGMRYISFIRVAIFVVRVAANGSIANSLKHLRGNPRLPTRTTTLVREESDFEAAARELNVFLHRLSSLPLSYPGDMSYPMPNTAFDATNGNAPGVSRAPSISPTTARDRRSIPSSLSISPKAPPQTRPEPSALVPSSTPSAATPPPSVTTAMSTPTAQNCDLLGEYDLPEDAFSIEIFYTYEITVDEENDIDELIQDLEGFLQGVLFEVLFDCANNVHHQSRTRNLVDIQHIYSMILHDNLSKENVCQNVTGNQNSTCHVVDGTVNMFLSSNSTDADRSSYVAGVLDVIELTFDSSNDLQTSVPGIEGVQFMRSSFDPVVLHPRNETVAFSTGISNGVGLSAMGAAFLVAGIISVTVIGAYVWRRERSDTNGMERLDTNDSYRSDPKTNDASTTFTAEAGTTSRPRFFGITNRGAVTCFDEADLDRSYLEASDDSSAAVREDPVIFNQPSTPDQPGEIDNDKGGDGRAVFVAADDSGEILSLGGGSRTDDVEPYCYPCNKVIWPPSYITDE